MNFVKSINWASPNRLSCRKLAVLAGRIAARRHQEVTQQLEIQVADARNGATRFWSTSPGSANDPFPPVQDE